MTQIIQALLWHWPPPPWPWAAMRSQAARGSDAYVRDLSTGLVDSSYSVSVDPSGWAEVVYNGMVDPQNAAYRQPFAADMGPGSTRPSSPGII